MATFLQGHRQVPRSAIAALSDEISLCRVCRDTPTGAALPHEPRPVVRISSTAKICIAGQAPGLKVHESGLPFDDPSGDRLRSWLGVDRSAFYDSSKFAIVPMGFCFPGYDKNKSDLPPRKECSPHWRKRIFDLMPQIELLLLIGGYAQKWHLGSRNGKSVTETVASWQKYYQVNEGPRIMPLPHPSWRNTGWLKKHPWFDDDILPILKAEILSLS